MKVAIIKYNAGNIQSVENALNRLGISATITDNLEEIRSSDKVIFPGVGEAGTTMKFLREHNLDSLIKSLSQPVLGICLGLQLMCSHTEEGDTDCLGIFDNKVRKFKSDTLQTAIKVPHIGWNNIKELKGKLFNNEQRTTNKEQLYVYFVHSYYAEVGNNTTAKTDYGEEFSSALEKDNFYAVQFHPEKSGQVGERILQNFLNI